MTGSFLTYALFAAAALLAAWLVARFPSRGGALTAAAAHAALSLTIVLVPLPLAMEALVRRETRGSLVLAVVGLGLPAVTYMFLAAAWLLRAIQRMLASVRP